MHNKVKNIELDIINLQKYNKSVSGHNISSFCNYIEIFHNKHFLFQSFSHIVYLLQWGFTSSIKNMFFLLDRLTIGKVDKEAAAIWKFQRYLLIMDFEERLCFPAPLTVINYIYILIQYIHRRLSSCRQSCISFCTCTTQVII